MSDLHKLIKEHLQLHKPKYNLIFKKKSYMTTVMKMKALLTLLSKIVGIILCLYYIYNYNAYGIS